MTVKKKLSDHNTIEVRLNLTFNKEDKEENVKNTYTTKMFEHDIHNALKEHYKRFEHFMDQFNEDELGDMNPDEQLDVIIDVIEEALEMTIPKKKMFDEEFESESSLKNTSNNFIPKLIRNLMRWKSNLLKLLLSLKNWHKNYQVYLELEEVEEALDEHYKESRKTDENIAAGNILKDPK